MSFNIPPSSVALTIKVLDLTTIANVPTKNLFAPHIEGVEMFRDSVALSFFLEHPSGRRLMFDLGVPHDLDVLGPAIAERLRNVAYKIESRDPADALEEAGIPVNSVEGVIWSHVHWDHKGDMRTFPGAKLIVGPKTIEHFVYGSGNSGLGGVNALDVLGREVVEVKYDMNIGRFPAMDYFGDGSFYLLDSPGHEVGHICGLVRTTPETFVLLGGDVAHHAAEFRPSKFAPMPMSLPCEWFVEENEKRGRARDQSLYDSRLIHKANDQFESIDRVQEADGEGNVLVLIAHDASVRWVKNMPFFPEPLNDWKERGLGESLHWSFVGDIKQALESSGHGDICTGRKWNSC